jgi:hypothetical protein
MKNKNSKGEVSTAALIGIIFLVVSFAIILFFLFRLNPGKITESEICHNSVVMRSSAISAFNSAKEIVPLNCKTQAVCISKDGTCEKLTSPEIKKVKEKEDVYNVLANQLVDCWWTFGEGKVDYVGKELAAGNLYCSLCSQVVFDDSVDMFNDFERGVLVDRQINNKEFYQYLSNNKIPDKDITYWDYLYEKGSLEEIEANLNQAGNSYSLGTINLDKQYYVTMGIISKTSLKPWMGAVAGGLVAAGLTVISGGTALFVLATVTVGAGAGGAGAYLGQLVVGESEQQYLHPAIIEASSDFDKLKCKNVNTFT